MSRAVSYAFLFLFLIPATAFAAEGDLDEAMEAVAADDSKRHRVPEILVTGRRDEEGVPFVPLDSVGSRDVLDPEEVRETGARDLNDLVQNIPAVSTRPYNGGEAAAPSFSMRGLPDDGLTEYIHILVDGVPASPLPYGWTAFSFMPITTERVYAVDYIRGGHAVRYSPNSVGGVLNFITRPVPTNPTFGMRATLGNLDYSSVLLSAGGTVEGLGTLLTYVDRRGEGYRDDGAFDQQDGNLKIVLDLDEESWLAASLSWMESEHQAPGGLTRAQFRRSRFGNGRPEQKFSGFRGVLDVVWHEGRGDDAWVEPFLYVSETGRELTARRPRFGTPENVLVWDDESFAAAVGVRAERTYEIFGGEHTFYAGLRVHRDWIPSWKIRSTPFGGGRTVKTQDDEFSLTAYSVHVDDTFEPVERVKVVIGARVEWIPNARGDGEVSGFRYRDSFFDVLPGVGISWELSDSAALFTNYHEGFRSPQVWGFAWTTDDSDELEFEEGRSFEVGVRFLDVSGLTGSLAYWMTQYDDFGVFYTGFYENLGEIESDGFDAALSCDMGELIDGLDGLVLSGSVTLQDSELRAGPNKGNEVPYAWETKAAWRARYEFCEGWVVSLGGTYVGESFSDDANTESPSADGQLGVNAARALWDARVGKTVALGEDATLELAAGATNLFDREWSVHSRGGFFGGGLVAGAPRQYYFSTGLTLGW